MAMGRHTVYRGVHVKADFELDREGIKKIALSHPIRKVVHNVVEFHARPIAEGLSADFADTGNYMRSFKIHDTEVVAGGDGHPMLRASCQLYNDAKNPGDDDSYALVVEVGDNRFAGHHVLSKTLTQMVAQGIVSMNPAALARITRRINRRRRSR